MTNNNDNYNNDGVSVINLEGKKEPFSVKKVYSSAKRAGASDKLAQEIADKIKKEVYEGMSTKKIYSRIKQLLSEKEPGPAIRFSLKKAMHKLGPTGFPFEKFTGSILNYHNYQVKLNQFLPGECIAEYEIDFVARKKESCYIGECKYHSDPGRKVDLKTALANTARFQDIKKGNFQNPKSLLVTNAKFTSHAVGYSRCKNVELLGWRWPKAGGLEYLIESKGLYPVTILPSLKGDLKQKFAQARLMLAKDLIDIDAAKLAKRLKISKNKLQPLISEAQSLFKTK